MRVILATRPPREAELADNELIWLDAKGKTVSRGRVVRLTYSEWMLAAALLTAGGAVLSREDLIAALYGDSASGGPENAEGALRVVIYRLRRRIKGLFAIALRGAPGHALGHYVEAL